MIARFASTCPRCHEPIEPGLDEIVIRRRKAIHAACAPGQDDE